MAVFENIMTNYLLYDCKLNKNAAESHTNKCMDFLTSHAWNL